MADTVIIHDLPPKEASRLLSALPADSFVFNALPAVNHCMGCFDCWTKTPGLCVIRDRHQELAHALAGCGALIILSRCVYGGLSPAVKVAMDRSIGYMLPYFYLDRKRDELHHQPRYKERMVLRWHLYGDATREERRTAEALAAANGVNLLAKECRVSFYPAAGDIPPLGGAV